MSLVYKARISLVRFAKVFPFILCALVFVSYVEDIIALATESYLMLDDSFVLRKPVSWFIGNLYVYDWYAIIAATFLAFAMETCWYNKASIVYLCVNAWERYYFIKIELFKEYIYAIAIANIIISGFFVWKGIRILLER